MRNSGWDSINRKLKYPLFGHSEISKLKEV